MKRIEPELTYVDGDFRSGLVVDISDAGVITFVGPANESPKSLASERLDRYALLPGMVSAHSHAFQRGLRGKAETFGEGSGSFWSWREEMYRLANELDTDGFERVSRLAFEEMLRAGITGVGEFHYLHHAGDGDDYQMDGALLAAAAESSIRIVVLDVCYLAGDVEKPLAPEQRKFRSTSVSAFLDSASNIESALGRNQSLGIAAHSLRAVPPDALAELHRVARSSSLVFHLHLEEQAREVEAVRAAYGGSPLGIVLERLEPGSELTAVHCTVSEPDELRSLLATGANVCLCPLTEANLADGMPDAVMPESAHLSIGTDSNLRIDFTEEMRLLEYGERLRRRERGVYISDHGSVAERLFRIATEGGARSLGLDAGRIEPGYAADFFTLDLDAPSLAGSSPEELLTAFVFGAGSQAIGRVAVGGRWVR